MVHTRFLAVLLLAAAVGVSPVRAQETSLELGGFSGISNYLGDLQQVRFETNEIHYAAGLFGRFNVNRNLSFKAHLYKGEISGKDSNYEGLEARKRNLSFRSPILEAGMQMEITFLKFGERQKRLAAPYFFGGGALFYFNPQTLYGGQWIALQPLGTEGQGLPEYPDREKYELIQFSIPMGIGFTMRISEHGNLGFEIGFRKTFTDYLDDISMTYPDVEVLYAYNPMSAALSFRSPEYVGEALPNPVGQPRGNSLSKDLYFFGGVTFSTVVSRRFQNKPWKKYRERPY